MAAALATYQVEKRQRRSSVNDNCAISVYATIEYPNRARSGSPRAGAGEKTTAMAMPASKISGDRQAARGSAARPSVKTAQSHTPTSNANARSAGTSRFHASPGRTGAAKLNAGPVETMTASAKINDTTNLSVSRGRRGPIGATGMDRP